MAKTTVVNRIDTIYIDTENPTVSVNTTVNDTGLKHNITITIRGIPITGISGLRALLFGYKIYSRLILPISL